MTATGVLSAPTVFHREYVFDGLEPVAEYEYEDGAPTLVSHYTYGNGRMVLLERTPEGGSVESYWYHYDGLGSVVALTDEAGDNVCQYKYDEYGNLLQDCPDLNHYTYTGQEYDAETGLVHFFARYYDAGVGSWLSQDSYRGDIRHSLSLNRYIYVHDNPETYIDWQGNFPVIPFIVTVVVVTILMTTPVYAPSSEEDAQQLREQAEKEKAERDKAALDIGARIVFEPYDWFATTRDCLEGECSALDLLTFLPLIPGTGGKADDIIKSMRKSIDKADDIKDSSKAIGLYDDLYDASKFSDELLDPDSWQEAEKMLSDALGVSKNKRKYFVEGMSQPRIPDFVTDSFIADSKFYRNSTLSLSEQLRDFVRLAKKQNKPLYIYVSKQTHVTEPARDLIRSTGGDVIVKFE